MSVRVAIGCPTSLSIRQRVFAMVAVARAAHLVRGRTIEQIADRLGSPLANCVRDASPEDARWADEAVCAVRPRFHSQRNAAERAAAAALLCALRGKRVRWCWGVRTPPAESTAWIEAGGQAFGAAYNVRDAFTVLVSTPAAQT